MSHHVLMTVELADAPTLDRAAHALGITVSDIDPGYGLVEIDPEHRLFALLVDEAALTRSGAAQAPAGASVPYQGPFSNPVVATFE